MPQSHFKPLQGGALAILTLVLSLATFMLVLDSTIANVAIPTIAGDLGASSSQGTWVITSFGVANAISIPITGWLAKRFGEVRLFLIATLLFVLASWLCGIANSLEMLIVFRVLQGAVAGPIIPLSQSLLLNNYPPEKRGMALAFWSMTIVVAPICGPILGGWISDNIHWGWIFFINVPIGLAVVLISWKILEGRESRISHQPVNTVGLILLVLGVGALQLMLDQGRELDWFNSTEIVVLTIIAAVGLIALIIGNSRTIIQLWMFPYSNPEISPWVVFRRVLLSWCIQGRSCLSRFCSNRFTTIQQHGRGLRLHQWDYCLFYLHQLSGNSAIKLICGF